MVRAAMAVVTLLLSSTAAFAADGDPDAELPRSLAAMYVPEPKDDEGGPFSLGAMAGYVRVRDADEGTWHGGVVARLQLFPVLAAEASISFHSQEFGDGDVRVTTYPVQVSALLFPLPNLPVRPYALAGGGWYYTRIDFDDSVGGGDDTDRQFAVHVGAGAEILLGRRAKIFADFRWLFLDEPGVDNSNIQDEEFDTWMVTLGFLFRF